MNKQIKSFINNGATVIDVINFLYTCDYKEIDIVKVVAKYFNYQEAQIREIFKNHYGVEFSPFVRLV